MRGDQSIAPGVSADSDVLRDRLAKRIILMAQAGERDVTKLRDDAIAFMQEQR